MAICGSSDFNSIHTIKQTKTDAVQPDFQFNIRCYLAASNIH